MDTRLLEMELYEALTAVETGLERLAGAFLSESALPAWTMDCGMGREARSAAAAMIRQIDFADGQAGNESQILPGLVGCSLAVLRLAAEVNGQKRRLKAALTGLKGLRAFVTDGKGKTRQVAADHHALARMGHARLHRLQAWRQFRLLEGRPAAAWFAWAESKKVYRISTAEARERLLAFGAEQEHILLQLRRLDSLDPDTPLAVVAWARPHARVNLFWPDKRLTQLRASLPILYPAAAGEALPTLTPITPERQGRTRRSARRDHLLEADPLLPSIHVYAYAHTGRHSS